MTLETMRKYYRFAVTFLITFSPAVYAFSQATNVLDPLRVYVIQPACFEYVFTSAMDKAEGKPVLSFNHINGRTVFAKEGEAVGEYTVKSFESSVERVFNPSINSYVENKAGRVKLQASDGKRVTLEMGKMLPQPGFIACLIWMDSGSWMYVSKEEVLPVGGAEITVASISGDAVTVTTGNVSSNVPAISEDEKNQLVLMWEERKKAAEEAEAAKLAEKKEREEKEKQVPTQVVRYLPAGESTAGSPLSRQVTTIRSPPKYFFGTEYRYPVSFETVPIIERTSSGTRIRNGMLVPRRFQTGFWGNSISTGSDGARVITVTQ